MLPSLCATICLCRLLTAYVSVAAGGVVVVVIVVVAVGVAFVVGVVAGGAVDAFVQCVVATRAYVT